MVQLRDYVRDEISGFAGRAVARTEWMNGCIRIGVQPSVDKDGKLPELEWFDEPQLQVLDTPAAEPFPDKDRHGPSRSNPSRSKDPTR